MVRCTVAIATAAKPDQEIEGRASPGNRPTYSYVKNLRDLHGSASGQSRLNLGHRGLALALAGPNVVQGFRPDCASARTTSLA